MEGKSANYFKILSLFRTDYTTSLHARAMANLLNVSHMTLLPYLKQLENLKILQSSKAGRNKNYSLNQNNILTKYYLTTTENQVTIEYLEKNQLIKKFAEHLNSLDTPNPLVLFGSYADNSATEKSDIDLFTIGTHTKEHATYIKKFQATYGKTINIKTATTENFNKALRTGDILIKEIIKKHIILRNPDPFTTMLWRYYVER
jgi:predicted nucleotidyltransferase